MREGTFRNNFTSIERKFITYKLVINFTTNYSFTFCRNLPLKFMGKVSTLFYSIFIPEIISYVQLVPRKSNLISPIKRRDSLRTVFNGMKVEIGN